jgi:Phenylacetic acid catabolic protein
VARKAPGAVPTDSSGPSPTVAGSADPRYLATIDRLLRSQAYRERGASELFQAGLALVPAGDTRWQRTIARHVQEERAHYARVGAVWSQALGQPVAELDRWVSYRLRDQPWPVVKTWLELAMAQFLFDRAGYWQLSEYVDSSFEPYRPLARQIVADERRHQEAGARLVVELTGAPGVDRTAAQDAFSSWLRVALMSFGRPGGEGNRYAIEAGLKRRDSAEVMRDFVDDVRPNVASAGLTFPAPETLALSLPAAFSGPA